MTPSYYTPRVTRCEKCGGPTTTTVVREASPLSFEDTLLAKRTQLATIFDGAPETTWRFISTMFALNGYYRSVGDLARDLAVHPSTLLSRISRSGLPPMKRLLLRIWLWRIFVDIARTGHSLARVGFEHGASSPQSISRSCRSAFGMTPGHIMKTMTPDEVFDRFIVGECITPYVQQWLTSDFLTPFNPANGMGRTVRTA